MVWMTWLIEFHTLTTLSPGNLTGAQMERNPNIELRGWLKLEACGQAPFTQPPPFTQHISIRCRKRHFQEPEWCC
jgi:hypothetical protein